MPNNGNGRNRKALELGRNIDLEWEVGGFRAYPPITNKSRVNNSGVNNSQVLNLQEILWNARQTARQIVPLAKYLAPTTASILLDSIPGSRRYINSLTIQLLHPLLQQGDRHTRQKEAEFFAIYEAGYEAEIKIANTGAAYEAALMEVLAAEASHTQSESEAAALIGTTLPMAFRVMDGRYLLRSVLPTLLATTARLVRFLHRHSRASRRLFRLVPVILRRAIATLVAARRWGCPITPALVNCIMAIQSRRIFANSRLVIDAIARNALIRFSTVAPARF
jgi:hypothetical protein